MSLLRSSLRASSRIASRASTRSPLALRSALSVRRFATEPPKAAEPAPEPTPKPEPPSSGSSGIIFAALAAALAAGGYYYYSTTSDASATKGPFVPTYEDYRKVYADIADALEDNDYDDGSFGPVLIRLAWHASGTYDVNTKTGGSNGATMRFDPEASHGANAGLKAARDRLEPIHAKYPWISYGDLWTLGGVCAVQEMGGPTIPWRPGREDADAAACTPDGRLPDAAQGSDHIRNIFYRMGFNDQEIVALVGAHALGRCHTDRSGFDGPWTFAPTYMTNDFYKLLLDEKWHWRKWNGPKQYEDDKTKSLMMLPADMALVKDKSFKKYVEKYAKDNDAFFADFSKAFATLLELGVPFKTEEKWSFPASSA